MPSTTIQVGPEEPKPTHHLRVVGGGKDIGIILCDGSGRPDPYQISRDRLATMSLKISQGNAKYSDSELPFSPMPQDNWIGGRGNETYEDDVTAFFDSRNMNTMFAGKTFLAGQMGIAKGNRNLQYNIPGSVYWQPLLAGSRKYLSVKFTADEHFTVDKLGMLLKRVGDPGTCTIRLRADSAGDPGAVLVTKTLAAATVDDILGIWQYLDAGIDPNFNGWDGEVGQKSDFDSVTDPDSDMNDAVAAAHDGAVGLEIKFNDANIAQGRMDLDAIDQKSCVSSFWFNKKDVAIDAGTILDVVEGAGVLGRSWMVRIYNDAGTYKWQGYIQRDDGGWSILTGSAVIGDGWHEMSVYWSASSGPGADNGWMHLYKDFTMIGYLTNVNNDEVDVDYGLCGMNLTNSAGFGGSYYMDTIKIDPVGALSTLEKDSEYWLEIYGVATDNDQNHWKVAVDANPSASATKESSDGSSWSASGVDLYWQIKDADDLPDRAWQFTYRGGEYILLDYDDAVPVCYIVGDRGAADVNTGNLGRLNDGDKSWTIDEHIGKVVKIIKGPGYSEAQPWRVITGNDATYLEVSPNWKIEHTTATEYVICGGDKVTQVFSATLGTGDIFDVLVVDDRIYMAKGAAIDIRAIRAYNNAGAWTEQAADEDTNSNKADRLGIVNHRETDLTKRQIWRGLNDTVQVSRGDVPAWDTDVTFGTGIDVGDKEDPIQNLVEYVDPDYGNKILWVLKKGSLWAIKLDIPDMVQLPEMKNVLSDNNSLVAIVHDTYLYFTLLTGGLERFYSEILDDVGPNRGRGLPAGRLGPISGIMGYPGKFFASVNAGTGFSSILGYDGSWHDKYRADEAGQPILSLGFQVVPGATLDRLWFVEGSTIKWIPFPSETIYPYNDSAYPYTHEGVLVYSRMHAGMVDLLKLFDSLSVFADELDKGVCWIEADYKVDSETAVWTPFTNSFYESPSHERNLVSLGDECITGKYLMLRLRLQTSNNLKTPIVRATLVDSVSRIKTKFGYVCQVLFETHPKDLHGRPDDYYEDGLAKIEDFDELADTLTILELSANTRIFDGLRVFCEAPALRPIYQSSSEGKEGFIGTLPITQVLKAEESE